MSNQENIGFTVGSDLFALSPKGLLACAVEWLESAKTHRSFDPSAPGFSAAAGALLSHPEIFVGAKGPDWSDSGRDTFWRMFFQARAAGFPLVDFAKFVAGVDKKDLAKGARDMLILAAKERDAKSFGELLAVGAARRSKLVMFSAYQNGGKAVAETVKQPTDLEAAELLNLGASMGRWSRSRAVVHDWIGFDWLMKKCGGKIEGYALARIGANSNDPELLPNAVAQYADGIDILEVRKWVDQASVMIAPSHMTKSVALSFAAAGSSQAAKAWARRIGAWDMLCVAGLRGHGQLTCANWSAQGNGDEVEFFIPDKAKFGMTMQMAACMSGSPDAVAWMRQAYADSRAHWLGSAELRGALSVLKGNHYEAKNLAESVDRAVTLSESVDLRHGVKPGQDVGKANEELGQGAGRRRGGL